MKALIVLGAASFLFTAGSATLAAAIATIGGLLYIVYDQEGPKTQGSGCWAVMVMVLLFGLVALLFFIK